MNPTHTDSFAAIRRRPDGSIDYTHYDARARVARSGAFLHFCRLMLALGKSGRTQRQDLPLAVSPARARPQTFMEHYNANARQHREGLSQAA